MTHQPTVPSDPPAGPPPPPQWGGQPYQAPAPQQGQQPPAPQYPQHQPPAPQYPQQQPPAPQYSQQQYSQQQYSQQQYPQQPAAPPYGAPGQPQGPGFSTAGQGPLSPAESRQWAMLGHAAGIIFGFLGPLVVMLIYGPRDPFVKDQSTEALNFQITATLGYLVALVILLIIPIPLHLLVWIGVIVFAVLGALAANKGETYRYPFALRLVK